MARNDSAPPPTPAQTRGYWYPRVRGGLTVIGGTLAYVALAAAFGREPSFATTLVGMVGSIVMMSFVWFLEVRRADRHQSRPSGQRT